MKKLLFTFVALLLPLLASADYVQRYESGGFIGGADAIIDGICYKFNSADQTASVTYQKIWYDDNREWPVNNYSGDVVIPETVKYNGVIYKVTSIGMGAFDNTHDATYGYSLIQRPSSWTPVTSITIPSSVTTIGDGAFRWCTSLNSINIPNSVKTIGEYAFSGCEGLTSISIPNNVTSIGESAFYYCTNLTSLTIPTNVSSIGSGVFACCYNLKSIIIPDNVTSIGNYAFDYCKELTSITIPDNVTSIGDGAFRGCI